MTRRHGPAKLIRHGVRTAMINSRAVPAPLPAYTGVSPTLPRHDFADPLPVQARLANQICYCVDVILLSRITRQAIGADNSIPHTPVNDYQPFAWPVVYQLRPHQAETTRCAVSWLDVDMLGPQAHWTVIAVAAIRQRHNGNPAILTRETLILDGPADGSASRLKK